MTRRAYIIDDFFDGTESVITRVWAMLLATFLANDYYNYYTYPDERYGATPSGILFNQGENEQALVTYLSRPVLPWIFIGLVAGINPAQYRIHSNKEAGFGRFDITIIPQNPSKLGIIIEVKSIKQNDSTSLKKAANEALQQIDKQHYSAALSQNQVKKCLKIGVAFSGKELTVEHRTEIL